MADTLNIQDSAAPQDPAEIEREIRQTQEEMGRTVDRIGEQLTMRNVVNALFDRTENGEIDPRAVYETAKRNPLALAMIAGGGIWLMSGSDANFTTVKSAMPNMPNIPKPSMPSFSSKGGSSPHHDYASHMNAFMPNEGEDEQSYRRRRDLARSNYFMIERGHEEEESSFRQRLDHAAEELRAKGRAWSHRASQAGKSVSQTGHSALDGAKGTLNNASGSVASLYAENPLIGGLVAAVAGAIAGSLAPITQTETRQLAGVGGKVREMADKQKEDLTQAALEKKDQLVGSLEERVGAA